MCDHLQERLQCAENKEDSGSSSHAVVHVTERNLPAVYPLQNASFDGTDMFIPEDIVDHRPFNLFGDTMKTVSDTYVSDEGIPPLSYNFQVNMVVPLDPVFYKDNSKSSFFTLYIVLERIGSDVPVTDDEWSRFFPKLTLLLDCPERDNQEVTDEILRMICPEERIDASRTILWKLRIDRVSKLYKSSPFRIMVTSIPSQRSTMFRPMYTSPILVKSKTPRSKRSFLPNDKKDKRRRLLRPSMQLFWWAKEAHTVMEDMEWSTRFGYEIINGVPDETRVIFACANCGGLQAHGHRPKCSLHQCLSTYNFRDVDEVAISRQPVRSVRRHRKTDACRDEEPKKV
jgi:hypothetical protein